MDAAALDRLLSVQDGVLARWQVLAAGGDDPAIERLVRRREWSRMLRGVYVTHTGPPSWTQRAWAAVLFHWPAALDGRSALRAHGLRGHARRDDDVLELVCGPERRVVRQAGILVRRSAIYESEVQRHLSPPRVRLEVAVLRVASLCKSDDEAVATVADAIQSGRTSAARVRATLSAIRRIPRRALLEAIVGDASQGALSALERRYLVQVERAHGLPPGTRQRRAVLGDRPYYRDVEYPGLRTVIELDGRIGHGLARDRWADLTRDLSAVERGDLTLRLGWGQVLEPHRLAALVGRVLAAQGWRGTPRPCGATCPVLEPG